MNICKFLHDTGFFEFRVMIFGLCNAPSRDLWIELLQFLFLLLFFTCKAGVYAMGGA